jgi:phosphoribosylaminoimidazolecarboxamide formyltransferase/IMP cyclohydrolase
VSLPVSVRRRAILSVSDKTGLEPFALGLNDLGFELISTGGTARALREAGLKVTDVAAVTGFPEIMDGRVKTLHPAVHAALLARAGTDDAALQEHGIAAIDLVVVNLYPFEATIARCDCTLEDAVENIDIGGPTMLRAAAKNHARVAVVVEPGDYDTVLDALRAGGVTSELRNRLAVTAFRHTARYDAAISRYLGEEYGSERYPASLVCGWERVSGLRYGENPHQRAAFYRDSACLGGTVARATLLQGKELSFNNVADADAALQAVKAFPEIACVIVKHANPCGVAVAATALEAYRAAYETDPTSAFGGIIAFNRPLDAETAAAILAKQFVEVLVAPDVEAGALERLKTKKNVRVLATGSLTQTSSLPGRNMRSIEGGLLIQDEDEGSLADVELRIVSERKPTDAELDDLRFAWTVVKYVKSNAIVFARGGRTLGIGAGQMSRVVSSRIAALKAADEGLEIRGAAMASDAFFPFRDGIDAAAKYDIGAVIQPGGSVRDDEVIAAANEHGMTMVFTGMRHFRH